MVIKHNIGSSIYVIVHVGNAEQDNQLLSEKKTYLMSGSSEACVLPNVSLGQINIKLTML